MKVCTRNQTNIVFSYAFIEVFDKFCIGVSLLGWMCDFSFCTSGISDNYIFPLRRLTSFPLFKFHNDNFVIDAIIACNHEIYSF